ncbi:sodium/nucleoside cotransporter 1 isoform X5 [Nomascus leucogenys]|uniref:sodium/nucleoside cotransporter 1 isoform X5 n=1 Tax=Nomascus leucogenys TaxID=61853 RepID=UPI00122D9121|nr:sodium/nucleoside cotransporter 1 isoform X5 [Nomascus leucogenys]
MENHPSRRRESISLTSVAKGLENMGADFLESLEEGQLPSSDLSSTEIRSSWSEAAPKPFSRWRNLQPALRAGSFCREHMQLFRWIGTGLLCTGFAAFLLVACLLDFQRALALFVLTCVVLTFLGHRLLKRLLGPKLRRFLKPQGHPRLLLWFKRGLALAAFLGLVLWLSLDTSRRPEQLVSFAGICVFIALLFACSKHHCAVSWQAVSWGLGLQFVLGLLVIRTEPGFIAFEWLGEQIRIFLSYTEAGSSFVFGEALVKDVFAFQVLPIIVFFSCVISVLYHVGLMQWVILKIAWLMQVTMGTTATETLSVAGNIFVSQTEAPLLIRPYLADMTLSEVHVVMTGGYATIAGSLLGAYISFGVRAEVITTFALCGFANFSSIGIMLGGLTSMVPQRKSDFSQIVLRALFTGACVSLVNACMAGILYVPRGAEVDCMSLLNTTLSSSSFEIYQCCREAFQSINPEFSPEALDNCCRFYNHTICA